MILKNPHTQQAINQWADWTRPKKLEHWKAGRSAMELARAWFTSSEPQCPNEVQDLLATNARIAGITFSEGYPEFVTSLPQRGEGRNHDLMLRGQVNTEAAIVCVEAKVDEPFGVTIGDYWHKSKASKTATKAPERIEALLKIVFGAEVQPDQSPWQDLRYQLLTGVAGTAIQAARDNAPIAVFVAHEFDTKEANKKLVHANNEDYANFVACFCSVPISTVVSGQIYGPVSLEQSNGLLSAVDVFVGKAVTAI